MDRRRPLITPGRHEILADLGDDLKEKLGRVLARMLFELEVERDDQDLARDPDDGGRR